MARHDTEQRNVYIITVDSEDAVPMPGINEVDYEESVDLTIEFGRNICSLASECQLYGKSRSTQLEATVLLGCRDTEHCDGEAVRRAKHHLRGRLATYPESAT